MTEAESVAIEAKAHFPANMRNETMQEETTTSPTSTIVEALQAKIQSKRRQRPTAKDAESMIASLEEQLQVLQQTPEQDETVVLLQQQLLDLQTTVAQQQREYDQLQVEEEEETDASDSEDSWEPSDSEDEDDEEEDEDEQLIALQQHIAKIEIENGVWKEKLHKAHRAVRILQARQQVPDLREDLRTSIEANQELATQVADAEHKLGNMEDEMNEEYHQTLDAMAMQCQELEQALEEARAALVDMQEPETNQEVLQVQHRVMMLETDLGVAKEASAKAQADEAGQREKLDKLQKEMNQMEEYLNETYQDTFDMMIHQMEDLKEKLRKAESPPQAEELEDVAQKLMASRAKTEAAKKQAMELEAKLQEVPSCDAFKREVASWESKNSAAATLRDQAVELASSLQSQVHAALSKPDMSQLALRDAGIKTVSKEIASVKQLQEEKKAEQEDLRQQLAEICKANSAKQVDLDRQKAEVTLLRRQVLEQQQGARAKTSKETFQMPTLKPLDQHRFAEASGMALVAAASYFRAASKKDEPELTGTVLVKPGDSQHYSARMALRAQ